MRACVAMAVLMAVTVLGQGNKFGKFEANFKRLKMGKVPNNPNRQVRVQKKNNNILHHVNGHITGNCLSFLPLASKSTSEKFVSGGINTISTSFLIQEC